MITDSIKNIDLYDNVPEDAKLFIERLSINTPQGRYNLSGDNYVNVESYFTKLSADAKYEAHEKYIDIQILLSGREKIYYCEKKNLICDIPYDSAKDIEFYKESVCGNFVELNGSNFVMLLPDEAHAPQIQANNMPENVLKAVVKIKV